MLSSSLVFISGMLPLAIVLFAFAAILWLFFNHGFDKLHHLEEWTDTSKSGEQIICRTLVDKFYVPENQILRNVYLPTSNDKTSEINRLHAKHLREFLSEFGELPIISIVTTITRDNEAEAYWRYQW